MRSSTALVLAAFLAAGACKPSAAPPASPTAGSGGTAAAGRGGAGGTGGTGGSAAGTGGASVPEPSAGAEPARAEPAVVEPVGAEPGNPPVPEDGPSEAPPASDTLTIAAAGDIAAMGGDQMRTAAILKRLHAEKKLTTILMLGDGAYRFSNLINYRSLYDPSWGVPELKAITRPIPGNHEYLESGNANGYFDYWNGAGVPDGPAGPRGLGYYAFDLGSWRVIALNSNEDCRHLPCGEGSAQLTWFRAELAKTTSASGGRRCTMVMVHNPRYQNGTHRGDTPALAPAWNALVDANVDLVLAAHEHNFQQFAPMDKAGNPDRARGVRSFVVGMGGARDFREVFDTAQMAAEEKRIVNTSGLLELNLTATGYSWKYHTVNNTVEATGQEVCH